MKNIQKLTFKSIMKSATALLLLLLLSALTTNAQTTIYVNDNSTTGDTYTTAVGNDVSGTGSAAAPYLTISKAITVATAGSTIKVDVGTYSTAFTINKNLTLQGPNNGKKGTDTRSAEAQIKDVKVTISGTAVVVFDGFYVYQTTTATGATIDVGNTPATVKNCIIERSGSTTGVIAVGVQTAAATSIIRIERNLFTGNATGGFSSGHKTWNSGIYSNGGSNITIDNNTFQNCRTALNQDNMSSGTTISNNTFNTNGTAISFGGTTATTGSYTISTNTFTVNSLYTTFNCSNVATAFRLDVTNNTFGSTAAASMTIAQCMTLESTIAHKGASSKNGLVIYQTGKLYKTATTTMANNISYASDGNTIYVSSGTFAEAMNITKSLTIYGNNYQTNPNDGSWSLNGARAAESIISASAITIAASNVEVNGFKITGGNNITCVGNTNPAANYTNITIKNNWITGNTNCHPIWFTASSGFPYTNIQVVNNRIESNTISPATTLLTGIDLWRSSGHTVSGNYISGMSYNGIKSDGDGVHSITGNRIAGCKVAGISLQTTYGNGQTVTVDNNTISACQEGVAVWSSTNTYPNLKFQITNNTITVDAGKLDINYPGINVQNLTSGDNSYTNVIRGNSITYSGTMGSAPYGVISGGPASAFYAVTLLGNLGKLDIQNNVFDGGNVAALNLPLAAIDMAAVLLSTNYPINGVNTTLGGTIRLLNNDMKNFKNGITAFNFVSLALDGIPSGTSLTVNENSIIAGTNGLAFQTATTGAGIAATCNWYGTTSYATAASKIIGTVTFTPFLVSGTDNDGSTLGFQPQTGVCTGVNVVTPTTGASSAIFTAITQTGMTITLTKGNGAKRLIVARNEAQISADPVENTAYTGNTTYGSGTSLGNGFAIFADSGNAVTVTGLTAATNYFFSVYEYNTAGSAIKYGTSVKYVCSASTLEPDADLDGVPDREDQYATDGNKAFDNYYPAAAPATLMFEDLWPAKGDYDFNDLVVDYRYNTVTNANNDVVEVTYTFITRAIGGSLHNGFAFQLDGINPNKITSVTGSKAAGASWISLNSNGTEAGQSTNANILVYDDAYKFMQTHGGFSFVNVDPNAPVSPNDTTTITVKFIVNGVAPLGGTLSYDNFTSAVFNPYIIINQDRGKEVHLSDRLPSAKVNATYFGQDQDRTNVSEGKYYKTANNLPWAINVSTSIPYPQEKIDISAAYLKFIDWASSAGASSTTWYLNTDGNRNNAKLIIR